MRLKNLIFLFSRLDFSYSVYIQLKRTYLKKQQHTDLTESEKKEASRKSSLWCSAIIETQSLSFFSQMI